MPKIDLYQAFQLDPRQSPAELAAQLDRLLANTDPANNQLRQQLSNTRAILGDPRRRAEYDRALTDPNARLDAVDIDRIARVAGPMGPPRLNPTQRALAIVGGVTAILLVVGVAITVALTSGNGDDKSTTNAANPGAGQGAAFRCWVDETNSDPQYKVLDHLRQAKWDEDWTRNGTRQPSRVVMLTDAYDLPPQLSSLVTQITDLSDPIDSVKLTQYADRNVGAGAGRLGANSVNAPANETLSIFNQTGQVVSTTTYTGQTFGDQPTAIETASAYGYYRIEAKSGIVIPAAAKGQQKNQTAALSILRDQFDDTRLWVLLLGGTKLYHATLYASNDWSKLGQAADVSHCEPK